jgi:hypothetical protein
MAGYVRQSAASIVTGADILAAPLNAEFNSLQSAFNGLTGHAHTGGSGDGAPISLTLGVTGILPLGLGGTGADTILDAQNNLELLPGTDIMSFSLDLDAIALLTSAADKVLYSTGLHTWALSTFTSAARNLLDDADASTMLTTLGVSTFAKTLIDDADAATMRTTLGLVLGTNVQAYDGTLTSLAAYNTNGILTQTSADNFTGRTITGTAVEVTVTNGDGVSGNPTISLPSAMTLTGKTITGGTFSSPTINTPTLTTIEAWSGMVLVPVDKAYKFALKVPFAGTINETVTMCVSGSCTATWKVNSSTLGATNAVSTTEVTAAQSTNNTFVAGDDIILTVSSNSSCLDMSFTVKYTRNI